MRENVLDFFLGALSPTGFFSYFHEAYPPLADGEVYLLKGGPGCGKSTLLREAAADFLAQGRTVELIHCSADPDSLDGVLCGGFAAFDATAPHVLEPALPGAYEHTVLTETGLDRARLEPQAGQIAALQAQYRQQMDRATRYVTAAGSLLEDSCRIGQCCLDAGKAKRFAKTLARRYFPKDGAGAKETVRLLSAVTSDGQIFFRDTVRRMADTIVVLDDEYGAAGKVLMEALRREACATQQEVVVCWCSMAPYEKIDHLLFPALRLAFITSNAHHPAAFDGARVIHAARFMDLDALKLRKQRLRFNKKAVLELLEQAVTIEKEAKAIHDQLEAVYTKAMDFSVMEGLEAQILKR